jgi:hypothetical protein
MRASARVRANRANAKRSTGPKSKDGKLRSALNAYKHGLTIPAGMLPEYEPAVKAYVALLVGHDASNEIRASAIAFAEAQVDIDRVRRRRHALYEDEKAREKQPTRRERSRSLRAQLKYLDGFLKLFEASGQDTLPGVSQHEVVANYKALSCEPKPVGLAAGMGVLAPQLLKLWRYEKRAMARRDKAAEHLHLLCSSAAAKAG